MPHTQLTRLRRMLRADGRRSLCKGRATLGFVRVFAVPAERARVFQSACDLLCIGVEHRRIPMPAVQMFRGSVPRGDGARGTGEVQGAESPRVRNWMTFAVTFCIPAAWLI